MHILGHIPPGHVDCVRVWSANFNAIVGRYSHIIAGQFYGHTHLDEFQLFFSKNKKESTGMQVVQLYTVAYKLYFEAHLYLISFKDVEIDMTTTLMLTSPPPGQQCCLHCTLGDPVSWRQSCIPPI